MFHLVERKDKFKERKVGRMNFPNGRNLFSLLCLVGEKENRKYKFSLVWYTRKKRKEKLVIVHCEGSFLPLLEE